MLCCNIDFVWRFFYVYKVVYFGVGGVCGMLEENVLKGYDFFCVFGIIMKGVYKEWSKMFVLVICVVWVGKEWW